MNNGLNSDQTPPFDKTKISTPCNSHKHFWEVPSTLLGGPIDPSGRSHRPFWEIPSTPLGGPIDSSGRSHTPFWEVPSTPSLRSNHPLLDPKHTLARYRTTCYSTPNTPLLDIEPPDPRPQTHPCSTSNTPLLDVELPVTRPQTYPCSMSNYPLLDLKHTLARCRTSRSRPHFEPSPCSRVRLNKLTISHLKPKPLIRVSLSPATPARSQLRLKHPPSLLLRLRKHRRSHALPRRSRSPQHLLNLAPIYPPE